MKKNIYSKLIMALAVVLMSLALTGCGNEDVWIYPILVSGDGVNINTHELTIEKGNTLQLKAQRDFITHGQGMAWKSSESSMWSWNVMWYFL